MIQEIGIVLDLSRGKFVNTEYRDGVLQLAYKDTDVNGKEVYAKSGYWESEPIVIQDKITAFKNVVRTVTIGNGTEFKFYTKTSDDGFNWSDYEEVLPNGNIQSLPAKYAMLKVEIIAENTEITMNIDDFDESGKYDNEFVNSSNGVLELKKEYVLNGELDTNQSTGRLFLTAIENIKYKKIDSLRILNIVMNPVYRSFVFYNGEYKKYDTQWTTVSTTLPSVDTFIGEGMDDLSVFDRKSITINVPMDDNAPSGEVLGNGKVFKEKVDLKRYFQINSIKVR